MELCNHRHQRWKKPIRSCCPCPLPARSASLQEVLQGIAELSSGQFLWNPFPGFSVGIFQWPGFSLMWQVQIGFLENTVPNSCIEIWRFQQNNTLSTLFLSFSLMTEVSHCHSWASFLKFFFNFLENRNSLCSHRAAVILSYPCPSHSCPRKVLGIDSLLFSSFSLNIYIILIGSKVQMWGLKEFSVGSGGSAQRNEQLVCFPKHTKS